MLPCETAQQMNLKQNTQFYAFSVLYKLLSAQSNCIDTQQKRKKQF